MSADKNVTIRISLDEMAERVKASPEFAELAVLIKDREQRIGEIHAEKVAAEARASSLSRELLDAMQARDSYRASAEHRVGMRREFEELLDCGDTMGDAAFERGLARLRELVAAEKELAEFSEILSRHNHEWSERCELAESRAERLEAALRVIVEDECHQTTRDVGAHLETCSEERPGDNSRWCAVCISRAALRCDMLDAALTADAPEREGESK